METRDGCQGELYAQEYYLYEVSFIANVHKKGSELH
jgi:hypothetical protein